jgi:hypothetical protein
MEGVEADKNLRNTVDELAETPVTSHQAGQLNRKKNDRRKRAMDGKKGHQANENMYD